METQTVFFFFWGGGGKGTSRNIKKKDRSIGAARE